MFGLFVRIYRLEKFPPDPSDDCAQNVALTVLRERRGVCRRIVSEHFHQREYFHGPLYTFTVLNTYIGGQCTASLPVVPHAKVRLDAAGNSYTT